MQHSCTWTYRWKRSWVNEIRKAETRQIYVIVIWYRIETEYDKLIVDEVDDKKWKKEESQQQIEEIIEEDALEHETDGVNSLRMSIDKFQQEAHYLNNMRDEEFRYSNNLLENS